MGFLDLFYSILKPVVEVKISENTGKRIKGDGIILVLLELTESDWPSGSGGGRRGRLVSFVCDRLISGRTDKQTDCPAKHGRAAEALLFCGLPSVLSMESQTTGRWVSHRPALRAQRSCAHELLQ